MTEQDRRDLLALRRLGISAYEAEHVYPAWEIDELLHALADEHRRKAPLDGSHGS